MKHPTPEYASTRILLEIGVFATVIVLAWSLFQLTHVPFSDPLPFVLGISVSAGLAVAGAVLALVGLAWMLRIFRGPRDQPPAWRYRRR